MTDVNIKVEVVYATVAEQKIVPLVLADQSTVQDAVLASGFQDYPDIEVGVTPVGIYAERVQYDTVLRDGDRVEIYRSLLLDPMEARRARAESQASQKRPKKPNAIKAAK